MCVKITGNRVMNEYDLQNLITSIIYRQKNSFNENEIIENVEKGLEGSKFISKDNIQDRQYIKKMVDNTLLEFFCSKILKSNQGKFSLCK